MAEFDPAQQLERMVAVFSAHPLASIGAVVALLLILGIRKDGLFSKIFEWRIAKANHEAALEQRRIEIIYMIENRRQRELPMDNGSAE